MRAMSLVSNEGDSEQNEIRSLQEKLESTMSLVKQLSGQLSELKEQVSHSEGTGVWNLHHSEQGDLGSQGVTSEDCQLHNKPPPGCAVQPISASRGFHSSTFPSCVTFLLL
jgi:hypothetical protein